MPVSNDVLQATYDNSDAGAALEYHAISEFRRNWEKLNLLRMPRQKVLGPKGPEYRIAHIYEMALCLDLSRGMKRQTAASCVFTAFRTMQNFGRHRFNELSVDERDAIWNTREFDDDQDRFHFEDFVKFPTIYFDDEFKHRGDEEPLFWVFESRDLGHYGSEPDTTMLHQRSFVRVLGKDSLSEAFDRLQNQYLKPFQDRADAPFWAHCTVINVTALLTRVDFYLERRLLARRLSTGQI